VGITEVTVAATAATGVTAVELSRCAAGEVRAF
jgi:hypothetical protein